MAQQCLLTQPGLLASAPASEVFKNSALDLAVNDCGPAAAVPAPYMLNANHTHLTLAAPPAPPAPPPPPTDPRPDLGRLLRSGLVPGTQHTLNLNGVGIRVDDVDGLDAETLCDGAVLVTSADAPTFDTLPAGRCLDLAREFAWRNSARDGVVLLALRGATERLVRIMANDVRTLSDETWCDPERVGDVNQSRTYVLCIDQTPRAQQTLRFIGLDGRSGFEPVLLPNRSFLVIVRAPSGTATRVTMGGVRGLTIPTTDVRVQATPPLAVAGVPATDATNQTREEPKVSGVLFGPRQPGRADVTVRIGSNDPFTVELEIDQLFAGAIRTGIAGVFGGAVDQRYEARAIDGGARGVVSTTAAREADFEVVIGATSFIWDLLVGPGGRSYVTRRPFWSLLLPSPYVGLGVVGSTADKVTAFQSLHLGGEWELSRGFSVALTAVLRSTHGLIPGYTLGAPVAAGASVEQQTTGWGVGLVVNFSPEFLQIATPRTSDTSSARAPVVRATPGGR